MFGPTLTPLDLASGEVSAPSDVDQLLFSQSDASPYRSGTARLQDTSANAGTYREKLAQEVFAPDGVSIGANTGLNYGLTTTTDLVVLMRLSAPAGQTNNVVLFGADGAGTRSWVLRINSDRLQFFGSPDGGVGSYHRFNSGSDVADGTTKFVAFRLLDNDGFMDFDGVAETVGDLTVGTPGDGVRLGSSDVHIGQHPGNLNYAEMNIHFCAIATGSDAADLWAERETVRSGFRPTAACDGIWYFEEGDTDTIVNAVDGTVGTIANYVSSARPVDTDRTYTVGNRLGYSPRMVFDGTDDYIDVDAFDITAVDSDASGITFSARFINFDTVTNTWRAIWSNTSGSGSRVELTLLNDDLRLWFGDGSVDLALESANLPDNQVHEAVFTARIIGGNLEVSLYLNGSLVDSGTSATSETDWSYISNAKWQIGYRDVSRYWDGIIDYVAVYDGWSSDGTVDGLTETNRWQNTGITDADWLDETGSVDGTVNGSPATIAYIPPRYDSTTLDAFGSPLTYSGRVPMDGIAKGYAWQGNGTDVRVDLDETVIPASADFTFTLIAYVEHTGAAYGLFNQGGTTYMNMNQGGVDGRVRVTLSSGNLQVNDVPDSQWCVFEIARIGTDFTLTVTDENENIYQDTYSGSPTISGDMNLGNQGATYFSGNLGPVSIATGGVTTEYHPDPESRNVFKLTSDSSDTSVIYGDGSTVGVIGGTLSTLYTLGDGSWLLPHLKNGARWASQNLVTYSEDFTNGGWTNNSDVTTTENQADVFGGTGAWLQQEESTNSNHRWSLAGFPELVVGTQYTLSVYIKRFSGGNDRNIELVLTDDVWGTENVTVIIDLDDGSYSLRVGTDIDNAGATDVGNGWWRVFATRTASTPIGSNKNFFWYVVPPGSGQSYQGDGVSGFYTFGWMLNEGSVAHPYNKTGANAWGASTLVPCDDTGVSADGNTPNVVAGDHPRGLTVRREGSVADDISKAIGLDVWGDEAFDDVIQRNDLAKRRVNEFSSDRYAAKIDGNIKNNAYFANDYRTVNASAGTFTSPNSIGEQDVTDLEFEPKITGIFGAGRGSDGNATDAQIGFGVAANASEQSAVSGSSEGNVAPSNATRVYSQSEIVTLLETSVALEDAEFVNNLSNGFRLNWTKANASEYIYNRFNLGGLDLERSVTFHTMNATLSDEAFAHGLSGKPTLLIMFTHGNSSLGTNTSAIWSLGAWAKGNQISTAFVSRYGRTITEAHRYFSEQHTINRLSNTGTLIRAMTVNSVDESEIQVSYSGSNITEYKFTMLAVRGCTAQVGSFDCNGGEIDIPHVGMTPRLWLPISLREASDSPDTTLGSVYYGLGACDGTNNVSCFYSDQDAKDTATGGTRARKEQRSDEIRVATTTGAEVFSATATLSTDNVKVTPTVTSSTYDQGGYITIGD